jgi:hypothetical protein
VLERLERRKGYRLKRVRCGTALAGGVVRKPKFLHRKDSFRNQTQTEKAHKKTTLVVDKSRNPKRLANKRFNLQTLLKFHLYLRNVIAPL